jgi:hypothetical protein
LTKESFLGAKRREREARKRDQQYLLQTRTSKKERQSFLGARTTRKRNRERGSRHDKNERMREKQDREIGSWQRPTKRAIILFRSVVPWIKSNIRQVSGGHFSGLD